MGIKYLFTSFLKGTMRDKMTIFWLILFPIILMSILIAIFSSFDRVENLQLKAVLLTNNIGNSQIISEALTSLDQEMISFEVKDYTEELLKEKMEVLRGHELDLIIVIPDDFNATFSSWLINFPTENSPPPELQVYYLQERQTSNISLEIVNSVIQSINNNLLQSFGFPIKSIAVQETVTGRMVDFKYKDFIFPGMLIFSFLSTSLWGITAEVIDLKTTKITKLLKLSPIGPKEIFLSFSASRLVLLVIQFFLLSAIAIFVFNVSVNPFNLAFIGYLLLATLTFLSLGFFLAGILQNMGQAEVVCNLLLQVMQFLGGIYFDVYNTPIFIRFLVYINPVTYIIGGARSSLGIANVPYPYYLSYTVPLLMSTALILLSFKFFKWTEEA
ncbi:MAG: Inner membrane transport permease YadH [candidate division WS2 bacterium]|uniref:Inner membrane transport permease YadH n=1 Tax=Psychracetigena formicireducens TaxID=2986056 RepID=A0A9E2F2E5_PSYF1|nr:Inner membrane transport permease YadH [Candidatus Psychracetigena formicireducens]MBT9145587.1 Inner membrane transport permease YadH [Candidatus Psychracetigena formicireducens]